jgi:predicted alpha/beta-fold hydrolase
VTKRVEPGGHLGFFARHGLDGRRWLDSYVDAWAKSVLRANGSSIGVT